MPDFYITGVILKSKYRGKGSVVKGASRVEVLWIKTNGKEESHDQ